MQKKTTTKNFITMAKIAKQLTELVGNTPLLQLNAYSKKENLNTNIIAKLEYFNPAGSVKDRIALAMIEDARSAVSSNLVQPSLNQLRAIQVLVLPSLVP